MRPKLTFAIPAYNMERWLPVAVESCLSQTEPDIEVLIVDDGSKDMTSVIADRFAEKDSRVRVIHQENQGIAAARRVGQDNATGEFILWLDADDFVDETCAEKMVGMAYQDNVDMVCGNAIVFSDTTFNTREYFYKPEAHRTSFANPAYWKSKVMWRWIFNVDFIRKIDLPHPNYKLGQDVCTMYEALTKVGSFSQCPDFIYYFRQDHKHPGSEISREVEHQLGHFRFVKETLVREKQIKPLVKYLNENYCRDIFKLAPRLVGENAAWRERALEISLEIFEGLAPQWFRKDFLAPELKAREEFLPLIDALIQQNLDAVERALTPLQNKSAKKRSVDKDSPFHVWRRRLKAYFKPHSRQALHVLKKYESAAQQMH